VSRRYLRPEALAGHVLVLIAVLVCLRLGWWQWNVAHETRGTIQNLGYALLWPVFGGAFIFMWLRFLYLEDERRAEQPEVADATGILGATPSEPTPARTGDPSGPGDPAVADRFDLLPVGAEPLDADPMDESSTAPSDPSPSGPVDGPSGGDATGIDPIAEAVEHLGGADSPQESVEQPKRGRRPRAQSTAETIAVAIVGGDDDDDEELAAYNEALARLAEQDNRRAR
jgi:DNA-binding transcriptional regulator of glucitol operon